MKVSFRPPTGSVTASLRMPRASAATSRSKGIPAARSASTSYSRRFGTRSHQGRLVSRPVVAWAAWAARGALVAAPEEAQAADPVGGLRSRWVASLSRLPPRRLRHHTPVTTGV